MPARSIRVTISNRCDYLVLKKSSTQGNPYFRSGALTDGWNIPDTIAAGQTIGFQAESDGVATGAEGWVTYDVCNYDPGPTIGYINIYWNIPYLSLGGHQDQYCRPLASAEGFNTSGDYPETDESQGFASGLRFAFGLPRLGNFPDGTGVNTPGAIILDALLGAVPVAGVGIPFLGLSLPQVFDSNPPHMYADVALIDVNQGFQSTPLQTTSLKLFPSPNASDWYSLMGGSYQSSDKSVEVVVGSPDSNGVASIQLTDKGSNMAAALSSTESVDLHVPAPAHTPILPQKSEAPHPPTAAVSPSMNVEKKAPPSTEPVDLHLAGWAHTPILPQESEVAHPPTSAAAPSMNVEKKPILATTNVPIADRPKMILPIQDRIGMAGNQVVLTLYEVVNADGSIAGKALQYQRFNVLNIAIRSEILSFIPPPPR